MRVALWPLVLSAGGGLAAPGGRRGEEYGLSPPYEPTNTSYIEEKSTPTVYSVSYEISTSNHGARPGQPASSFLANSSYHDLSTGSISEPTPLPSTSKGSLPAATCEEKSTVYTTVYPVMTTGVHNGYAETGTYETTATVTSIYTAAITVQYGDGTASDGYPYQSTGGSGVDDYETKEWTTFKWGTTWLSYSAPSYRKTSTSTQGYPPHSYPGSTVTVTPYPSGTVTYTGSHSSGSNQSGSTYPAENSTSYPVGTSTGTASRSGISTSTCSKPTSTPFGGACIPCQGQPGSDPEAYCGYTINDNSYKVMPKTCKTRFYDFEITNTTIKPDGISRIGLVINGQMPGPKIEANWGDTITVRVANKMQNNGTSIHFHGLRQFFSNEMDGVPSITQCPIAPGDSMTYTFKASNYGTSWYHSHFALQTYEGVFGPMVIHGPAAEQYDEEEMIVVQDWSHATIDSMYDFAQDAANGGPNPLDTGLINGMNMWGTPGSSNATGQYFQMNVIFGRAYRIRLVNTAIQSTFKFYIDGHKFRVIATDFVPIQPYETTIVNINIGQRYDLIFKADQPIGNYWMRADNQQPCGELKYPNVKAIVSYIGATLSTPTSTEYNYTAECVDEPLASLVPILPINAGAQDDLIDKTVLVKPNGGSPNIYKWTLSGTTFQSQWGQPTLQQIVENGTAPNYSGDLAIQVPKLKDWVYIIIDSPIPVPHPIHLHGHDFLILAQGTGLYNSSSVSLTTINPPRRDVALMPWDPVTRDGGHLVLAYQADNPGVWLVHCHIGWHTAMGFALQIIEGIDSIKQTVRNSCGLEDTCKNWHTYAANNGIYVNDAGV